MNLLDSFYEELTKYLSRSDGEYNENLHKLVKLQERECFDFQFPVSLNIWKNYLKLNEKDVEKYSDSILLYSVDETNEDSTEISIEALKEESKRWTFTIENVELKDWRCSFTICRPASYARMLDELSSNSSYGKTAKIETETVSIESDGDETSTVTQFRVHLVTEAVKNLMTFSEFVLVGDPSAAKYKILVTSKSKLCKENETSQVLLTCGPVTNPVDKKISNVSAQDYVNRRTEDMHLISIHKYGVRVKNDNAFKDIVRRLGKNAATLDLLEVKQASSITLSPDPKQAFILYNSARIETLMEKFNKKVQEGYYKKVPEAHEIDTSLLKEAEEWQLFKLLLTFPNVLKRSIHELPRGRVNVHLIHKFLSEMVSVFSVYYRRVRLLTENRIQLMPVLQAKIYFLRSVQKVFNETLKIFSIEPVAFM